MTNSNVLREWLNSKGLKLKAVAEKMGITAYSLSRKIDNESEFKASEIAVFSTEYGMPKELRNRIFFGEK